MYYSKYADDTMIVGLLDDMIIQMGTTSMFKRSIFLPYGVETFFKYLNVKKTKEMVIDYHGEKEIIAYRNQWW